MHEDVPLVTTDRAFLRRCRLAIASPRHQSSNSRTRAVVELRQDEWSSASFPGVDVKSALSQRILLLVLESFPLAPREL